MERYAYELHKRSSNTIGEHVAKHPMIKKLNEMVEQFGPEVCEDPKLCRNILNDYCPNKEKEVSIIVAVVQHGIAKRIFSEKPIPNPISLNPYVKKMEDLGYEKNIVMWAVDAWATCLSGTIPASTPDETALLPAKTMPLDVVQFIGSTGRQTYDFGMDLTEWTNTKLINAGNTLKQKTIDTYDLIADRFVNERKRAQNIFYRFRSICQEILPGLFLGSVMAFLVLGALALFESVKFWDIPFILVGSIFAGGAGWGFGIQQYHNGLKGLFVWLFLTICVGAVPGGLSTWVCQMTGLFTLGILTGAVLISCIVYWVYKKLLFLIAGVFVGACVGASGAIAHTPAQGSTIGLVLIGIFWLKMLMSSNRYH